MSSCEGYPGIGSIGSAWTDALPTVYTDSPAALLTAFGFVDKNHTLNCKTLRKVESHPRKYLVNRNGSLRK